MTNRCCVFLSAVLVILTVGLPRVNAQSVAGKTQAVPHTTDGKSDLSGVWQIPYVLDMGKEIGGLPFTPAGEKAYKANLVNNIDPTSFCLFPGVPRISHSPYPVEI